MSSVGFYSTADSLTSDDLSSTRRLYYLRLVDRDGTSKHEHR